MARTEEDDEMSKIENEVNEEDSEDVDLTPSIASLEDPDFTQVEEMSTNEVAFTELGETEEIRELSLRKMKSAIVKHARIGEIFFHSDAAEVDRFLLRFLRTNKFNRKKSIQALENYIMMRLSNPHWFMLLGDEKNVGGAMDLIERGYVFVAPGTDKAGRRVLINLGERLDPSRHSSSDMMKAIMMCVETLLAVDDETQVRGLSYVFHCKGIGLRHCGIWSLFDAKTMLCGCRKNIPLRHRAMFVVQTPFGMGSVVEFVKSFCDLKIRKRIHVVPQPEKLHTQKNRLLDDPDVLPVELLSAKNGGRRTAQDMATAWKEVVIRHMPFLKKMDFLTVEDFGV